MYTHLLKCSRFCNIKIFIVKDNIVILKTSLKINFRCKFMLKS